MIREYVWRSAIASVMMQYSLLDRRPEEEMLALLHQHQIGVFARGALAQGLLVGKSPVPYLAHPVQVVSQAAEAIKKTAGKSGSPSSVAVQYVLHAPAVASAVLGIRTQEQLNQSLAASQASALPQNQIDFLQKKASARLYEQHR